MPPENESPLERARRRLYENQKIAPPSVDRTASASAPSSGWQKAAGVGKQKVSAGALFLFIAAGFFVLAGIIAAAILFLGGRSVSSDHIDISVEGPTTVAGGDDVPLFVVLKNNNPTAATNVTLSADFPDGAYSGTDRSTPLGHYTAKMDDIPAGGTARQSIRAVFFGAENQKVTVPISLEYRTENSSAVFQKEKDYAFTITTAPLSVNVTALSQVGASQPFTVVATVRSNAPAPLENVAVHVQYPFGFLPTDASPTPVGDAVFPLGTFAPGEEKEIRLTGTVSGEDGDQRIFKFFAGALASADAVKLADPVYTEKDTGVTVTKSFLATKLTLNQSDTDPLVVIAGESVHATLSWLNTLASTITDGEIDVKLSGDALDTASVRAVNGFYRSADTTIVFSRDTAPGLHSLAPDDTGNGSFSFSVKAADALAALRNPAITLTVSVAGHRVSESGVPESLTSTVKRTIQIGSGLSLTADAVRTVGPFANTGPWPPHVDKETTYTIRYTAKNTVNSVANAAVSVVLPAYVRFTGQAGSGVTYNDTTRTVTWAIGDMAPGASVQGAFQVGLTPNSSQKGTNPILLPAHSITGFDRFVQQQVTGSVERVTAEATEDPAFQSGDERVQ